MFRKLTWLIFICTLRYIYYKDQPGNLFWKKNCLGLQIQKHPLCWVPKKLKPALIIQTQYFFIDYKVYSHRQCSSTGDATQLNLHELNRVREMLLHLLRRILRLCKIIQFDVCVWFFFFFFINWMKLMTTNFLFMQNASIFCWSLIFQHVAQLIHRRKSNT